MVLASENPFKDICIALPKPDGGEYGKYYSLTALNDPRIDKLPYSIKILEITSPKQVEIPFKPACVLLQDFTGVPTVVNLACMRDAVNNLGGDSNKINLLRIKTTKSKKPLPGPRTRSRANAPIEIEKEPTRAATTTEKQPKKAGTNTELTSSYRPPVLIILRVWCWHLHLKNL
ncbi:hypothetical protein POM88_016286 [Heracleum sosnowskyi]|uniref:Uncharacterized protein n=1 Tax=Heracleum sosnowskyi TaxID=360622 RepID=A0AAD8INP5_9APIA|nr:hypothetical protein POM88_016286 [Heracleum sosnowskyi]